MATLVGAPRPGPFAVFRKRNFVLLWIAQFISTMGAGLTAIAASILVYRETGSAFSVGLMLMATALPSLVVGLVAGVFVDRFDRKRIMIAAELIRAVLIVLIPVLLPFGVGWLYLLVLLSSAVAQFFDPAMASVLPEVATDEELAAANSMMAVSNVGALTVGYAGAGLLATEAAINWAFYFDAASFVVSALCITLVGITPLVVDENTNVGTVVRNLRVGVLHVRDTAVLRSLFLVFAVIFFTFGLWNSLMLPFALRALDATEFEYGLFEGLSTVGFVLGSLLMASLADRLHEGQWIAISITGMGLCAIGFGLSQSVPVAIVFSVAMGLMNAPSYIGRSLLIQRNTTREVRGRVNSAFFVARDTVFMAGMAAAGFADLIDVRVLLLVTAGMTLTCGLFALAMPGLGQPTAEWRRTMAMLRTAPSASGLGLGRAALPADVDLLAVRLPSLAGLTQAARRELASKARVYEAAPGTAVVRRGEASDAAFFLLDGRTVASPGVDGDERVLEVHNAGDFFGEIAALTGVPRTATVVAEEPTTLLQVPAESLRRLMDDPQLHRLVFTKLTERMLRMDLIELPRLAGLDQEALRELRTPGPQTLPVTQPLPATT